MGHTHGKWHIIKNQPQSKESFHETPRPISHFILQGKMSKRHPSKSYRAMKPLEPVNLQTAGVIQACEHFIHSV